MLGDVLTTGSSLCTGCGRVQAGQAVPPTCASDPSCSLQQSPSSLKHLVGGSYDVIVGSDTNGNKPIIHIEGSNNAVHLGSILEAESIFALSTSESCSGDMIQPMLELMAISQVATFPSPDVPVVNFIGNKFVFRPPLYFKELDVVLTTPQLMHLHSCEKSGNERTHAQEFIM